MIKAIAMSVAFVVAGAACAYASGPLPAGTLFLCDEGDPNVKVLVPHDINKNPILMIENEQLELAPTPVASGYGADLFLGPHHWMIHGKGSDQLVLMKDDDEPKQCSVMFVDDKNDVADNSGSSDYVSVMGSFSLGGNVRSGPGTQYDKTDSLPFGEPVSLVSRAGVEMDGYEWFEIEYSEGLRGYQWGGILCSNALHIIGIYECPAELN